MKYRVCVENKNYQVLMEDIYPDPGQEMMIESGYARRRVRILSWSKTGGIASVLIDGVPYDVEIVRDERGGLEAVKIDNDTFAIDEVQAGKILTTRQDIKVVKEGVVKAFMPGLVARVLKSAGDRVAEGDTVLYLEAMKMENAITAPRDGVISRVGPAEGATVLTGDLLFVVE